MVGPSGHPSVRVVCPRESSIYVLICCPGEAITQSSGSEITTFEASAYIVFIDGKSNDGDDSDHDDVVLVVMMPKRVKRTDDNLRM